MKKSPKVKLEAQVINYPLNDLEAHQLFQLVDQSTLLKFDALSLFLNVAVYNHTSPVYSHKQLQHLWLKLHRKYRFKYADWVQLQHKENIHSYLVNEEGHGLQNIIRFYQDRNLTNWKTDAFEFGLKRLIDAPQFINLDIYFLNSIICNSWETDYLNNPTIRNYFMHASRPKTKEMYTLYLAYKQNPTKLSAEALFIYLEKLNPHYTLQSKSTPTFFKQLHEYSKIN